MQSPTEDNILYTLPHVNYDTTDQTMELNTSIINQRLHNGSNSAPAMAESAHGTTVQGTARRQCKQKKQDRKLLGISAQFENNSID